MACYYPVEAWQTPSGAIVFSDKRVDTTRSLLLPCNRCFGCRLERSRQWAIRCTHEAKLHSESCFITLTYAPENLPPGGSLAPRDVVLFFKRFRKRLPGIRLRYFMCGEYGEEFGRPHYHICLFGWFPPDAKYCGKSGSGAAKFTSDFLVDVWKLGDVQVGEFTSKAAAYTARYIMEKVNGDLAPAHYRRIDAESGEVYELVPEFNRMSRGLGRDYVRLYWQDMLPSGNVVFEGREVKAPRFYDKMCAKLKGWEEVQYRRFLNRQPGEDTPERLAVRERVAKARLKLKPRHKDLI